MREPEGNGEAKGHSRNKNTTLANSRRRRDCADNSWCAVSFISSWCSKWFQENQPYGSSVHMHPPCTAASKNCLHILATGRSSAPEGGAQQLSKHSGWNALHLVDGCVIRSHNTRPSTCMKSKVTVKFRPRASGLHLTCCQSGH